MNSNQMNSNTYINIEEIFKKEIEKEESPIIRNKVREITNKMFIIIKEYESIGSNQYYYQMRIANGIRRNCKIIKTSNKKCNQVKKLVEEFKTDIKWLNKFKKNKLITTEQVEILLKDIKEIKNNIKDIEWYMNLYKEDLLKGNITG